MDETVSLLDELRAAVGRRRTPPPAARRALAATDDPAVMRKAGRVLAGLVPTDDELRPLRVTVVATCTVGPFEHLLRAALVGAGALPAVEPGEYGSFELTLASAGFAADGDPDIVCCLLDESYFLPDDWSATDPERFGEQVDARLGELRGLLESCLPRTSATVLLHTVPLPAHVRDSVLSWRGRAAVAQAWHRLNADILGLAGSHRQVVVVDLVSVLAEAAVPARDDRLHRYADLPYTDGALLALAHQVRRVAQVRLGLSRKVLALDLDDTLWGGVLGEVGAGAVQLGGLYPGNCYRQLQRTALRLRSQGVILVLTSKNDPLLVEEALTEHPEVLLRPEAFAVRAVNWSSKSDNLRQAAESLGMALDSFVLVDDSAFERGQVADALPGVAVVSAGGDPAHVVRTLLEPGWFDTADLTDTDQERPQLYRSRALRGEFSASFSSSEEYLHALELTLTAEPASGFALARVAQLAARTNQFNLTGIRFDETATAELAADEDHLVASFSVTDRFGDEGIVGAAWVHCGPARWQVLNLVLSCRVLGRGLELAAVDWLARQARAAGATELAGRFVRSRRNGVAADVWTRAGFTPAGDDAYTLDLTADLPAPPAWVTAPERSDA